MGSLPLFTHLVEFVEASKYLLLFIGSYVEGTAVMIGAGLLWREGALAFWPMYAALVAGDFLADMMWYFIGYFAARPLIMRWGYLVNATPETLEKVERRFKDRQTSILIISKLTMGFGLMVATLLTAGMLRISVIRYAIIELLGGFVWIFFLILVGYFFGNVLDYIPSQFKIAFGVAVVIAAIFLVRYINQRLSKADF